MYEKISSFLNITIHEKTAEVDQLQYKAQELDDKLNMLRAKNLVI